MPYFQPIRSTVDDAEKLVCIGVQGNEQRSAKQDFAYYCSSHASLSMLPHPRDQMSIAKP